MHFDLPMPEQQPDQPTPHEDLERQPDGVPHDVVGLVALFSCLVAVGVAFFLITTGHTILAIAVSAVVAVLIIFRLSRRAERERDHVHPSL